MRTCPVCGGSGSDGTVDHGPSLDAGDHVLVVDGHRSRKAKIVGFKPSGIKLRNHGAFTVVFDDTSAEVRDTRHGRTLHHLCPRCRGDGQIEPTELDLAILNSETTFLISGVGTCRAVEREGRWVKFKHPMLRGADLLARGDQVYSIPEHRLDDGGYQTFRVALQGDTNVSSFEPGLCDQHGWFEGESCPDC